MVSLTNKIKEMYINPTRNTVEAIKEFMDNCKKIGGEVVSYNYEAGDELFAVCELHGSNDKSARITLSVDPSLSLAIARAVIEDDKSNTDSVTQIDSYGDMVCKFSEDVHGRHPDYSDRDIEPSATRAVRSVVCTTKDETMRLRVEYDYKNPHNSNISSEYHNLKTHGKTETTFEI